jgi:hypothetical protein
VPFYVVIVQRRMSQIDLIGVMGGYVVPFSTAFLSGKFSLGDRIVSIDEAAVNPENLLTRVLGSDKADSCLTLKVRYKGWSVLTLLVIRRASTDSVVY